MRSGMATVPGLLAALLLMGCQGAVGDARSSGAVGAVTSVASLRNLWGGMENATAAEAALARLGDVSPFLALLSAANSQTTPGPLLAVQAATFPSCVSGTSDGSDGTATLTDCVVGNVTVRGTATRTGNDYRASLTFDFGTGGYVGTVSFTGDLTLTDRSLDGSVTLELNLTTPQRAYALNLTVTFDGVVLCPGGLLPSGGSLTARGNGNDSGRSFASGVTATFGPGCGTARIGS